MPYADVMALFQEVQRQRGYELLDAISVSSIADMDKRGQKAVLDRARKLTGWSWEPPPSVYESMPDAERGGTSRRCSTNTRRTSAMPRISSVRTDCDVLG